MFGAHLAYWTHRDFAVFVLTQLFMDFTKKDEVTIVPQIQDLQQKKGGKQDDEEEEKDDSEGSRKMKTRRVKRKRNEQMNSSSIHTHI